MIKHAITRGANCRRSCRGTRRRGSVYVFVLMTSLMVSVVALAIAAAGQINGRVITQSNDALQAEALAESAVEFALQAIAADPDWRTNYPANFPAGPVSVGNGTFRISIVDELDGDLTNNSYDPIRVYGIGQSGGATRVYSVRCQTGSAMDCLGVGTACGGGIALANMTLAGTPAATLASNSAISASGVMFASPASLQCASITMAGCTGAAPGTTATAARQLPDPAHVFDYYASLGTTIPIAAISSSGGIHRMQRAVLSPASNPYGGGANPQGIYVIDCQGQDIQILNMRIVGTLVLRNPGSQSALLQSNYMAPAVNGFPSLMVLGNFALACAPAVLTDTAGVNYNPPGTPYLGVADNTFSTSYPSRLESIVYVSGDLTCSGSPAIKGVLVVGGTLSQASGSLTLAYTSTPASNPPPGFTTSAMIPVPATWQWETAR